MEIFTNFSHVVYKFVVTKNFIAMVICLGVTCASSLFNAGVEEKLISYRNQTGHQSNALLKIGEVQSAEVSEVLAPKCSTSNEAMTKDTEDTVKIGNSKSFCDPFNASAYFKNYKMNINGNK